MPIVEDKKLVQVGNFGARCDKTQYEIPILMMFQPLVETHPSGKCRWHQQR